MVLVVALTATPMGPDPTAIVAVRGTIFSVSVDQTGDTEVGVAEGLVSVAGQAQPENAVT